MGVGNLLVNVASEAYLSNQVCNWTATDTLSKKRRSFLLLLTLPTRN